MKNISRAQRKFLDAFRKNEKSIPQTMKDEGINADRLAGWMRNDVFSRLFERIAKGYRLASRGEMVRLTTAGVAAGKEVIDDPEKGLAMKIHLLRTLATQVRDADKVRAKRPKRVNLIHVKSEQETKQLITQLTRRDEPSPPKE